MDYPIISGYNLIDFKLSPKGGRIMGWFLPLGGLIYLLAVYRRKLLLHDIQTIVHVSDELLKIIKEQTI
ncbi:MAG: hypothetical protein HUK08_09345 [Bacteroidaceae bacterium]|nr:hypothetical protein [Bacteroidaceae bacterium]